MSEDTEISNELEKVDLREFTLRIPGEYFFTETIQLAESIPTGGEGDINRLVENYLLEILEDPSFSPYPVHQLAWGYFGSLEEGKVLLFASPISKLRQLGWQNLESFRRVFPSFISILGKTFTTPTILFLKHDESLSVAAYQPDCGVPDKLYSMTIDEDEDDAIELARGKLLSLLDLENYEVLQDVLVTGEVERLKDGLYNFEHEWLKGLSPDLDFEQDVVLDGNQIWTADLRSLEFKETEKKSRKMGRQRWKLALAWGVSMAAVVILFLGTKIFQVKLEEKQLMASQMAEEIPMVLDSQRLLEKLKQNKLGGIDPFGSTGRLYPFLGETNGDLNVWFTMAHFETRNDLEIKGEGKDVPAINLFLENLKKNKVANLRVDRSGKDRRKIRSPGDGGHYFEVEITLVEDAENKQS